MSSRLTFIWPDCSITPGKMSPPDIMVRSIFLGDVRTSLLAHVVHYPFSCSLYSHPSGCAAEQDKAPECRYHADMCQSLNRDKRGSGEAFPHPSTVIVQWTWSSTTPEKIPGTHNFRNRDSSRLISQGISDLRHLNRSTQQR